MLPGSPFKDGTVLIVSEDFALFEQLEEVLRKTGLNLQRTASGKFSLSDFEAHLPSIAVLDCRKQKDQPFAMCKQLRSSEQLGTIPVLSICAEPETAQITQAFQTGFQDVITWPFRKEEVRARISAHLRFYQQHQELLEQQERFQQLADATSEGIVIHDHGIILEVNKALLDMIDFEYKDIVGKDAFELLTPESHQTARTHFEMGSEQPLSLFATKRNGVQIPIVIQGRSMQWHGRTIRIVAVRDISMQNFLHREQQTLSVALGEKDHFGSLVGRSRTMRKVYEKILRSAATDSPVLIHGETGTGKELTARMVFDKSDHHKACFLPVNCASIPDHLFESQFFGHRKGSFTGAESNFPGYFEQAHGGTLFLDEVGELPLSMQAKLLRALEDHTYTPVGGRNIAHADVRIITATNKNLHDLERQGKFRSDFLYRLYVLSIELPPLRARKEDLPLLVLHYLKLQTTTDQSRNTEELPQPILQQFIDYNWPGNVRELFNELERYLVDGEVRLNGHLKGNSDILESLELDSNSTSLTDAMSRFERFYIHKVLKQHQGQKLKTAEALRVDRKTLYKKLRKFATQPNSNDH